ncbi:glycosyltransferase family 2 protein [Flavobacterium daejeonense]|uniref:glycosyltransferase family 2 protein n=1 Tax=Flavobacterium daejeonense TaxID=350893 RepID=UPI00047B96D0|nr:glycosyltransferase family A protein [Flavobacterium daejeonense]
MNELSKVSIIVPCYNQAHFLAETLESVLQQTYGNWECIIMNDGSIDHSETIILETISGDHRFHYCFQENKGVCTARNNAIQLSKGDYILPLDGDDILSPEFLARTVAVLDARPEIKVVYTDVQFFGKKKGLYQLPSYSLGALLGQNLMVCTSLFRRIDYDKTIGYNPNMKEGLEDWDFWLSLLGKNGNAYKIPEALFYYRIQSKSRTTGIDLEKQHRLRRQIYENHKDLYSSHFFDPKLSFEYTNLLHSKEYRFGSFLLKPLRLLKSLF